MRSGLLLVASFTVAALFATSHHEANAVPITSLDINAAACVTPVGGRGVGCVNNTTEPTATNSQTSAGINFFGGVFTSNASAFTDASNFGELRMSGSTSITGRAQANAGSQIIIRDFHHFSDAGLNGQPGVATGTVLVLGSLATSNNAADAFGGQATAQWRYTYSDGTGPGAGGYLDLVTRHVQLDVDSFSFFCTVNGSDPNVCADTYGLFSFDIPFTWGADDPFLIQFNGGAVASSDLNSGDASASYDLANSIFWGGFSNVRASGNQITDFDYSSGSGYDWRISSIAQTPPSGVPEPSSAALLGLGFLAFAISRYRRKARSDDRWNAPRTA